jgi:tetratricopeptide (TPR) repeat protein
MDLAGRSVSLYGRFSQGNRERFQAEIALRGGTVVRDLTRRSDLLVIGAHATALIDSGALQQRLRTAVERRVPILGEKRFAAALAGLHADTATLPLAKVLAQAKLTFEDAQLLAAFDLIALSEENCRFADAAMLRTAGELAQKLRSRGDIVRILSRAQALAPEGRHKIVLTDEGLAALQWEGGLTTLDGQGFLPLDMEQPNVDELFEQAEIKEAQGDRASAARLYEACTNADRSDPIAPFNLGNIHLAEGNFEDATRAYARALARDADFAEARYNLGLAYEALGKLSQAQEELRRVLALEPKHRDAMFNLAQLLLKTGKLAEAKLAYERYLALDPPADWAAKARKAITYCAAQLARL